MKADYEFDFILQRREPSAYRSELEKLVALEMPQLTRNQRESSINEGLNSLWLCRANKYEIAAKLTETIFTSTTYYKRIAECLIITMNEHNDKKVSITVDVDWKLYKSLCEKIHAGLPCNG